MGACYSLDKAEKEDKCKVQPVGTLSGRLRGGQWGSVGGWGRALRPKSGSF